MSFIIGLTGSIGMGKSTTAQMFADEGVPIWDADAAVARLYAKGGAAVAPIGAIEPNAILDGAVDRQALKRRISNDPGFLDVLNQIVHPLVAEDRETFINTTDATVILLDIPLLFEVGADEICDAVVVVSVPADVQRARVLARGTMTEDAFENILACQMPDREKRRKADVVIETLTLDAARAAVQHLLSEIAEGKFDA